MGFVWISLAPRESEAATPVEGPIPETYSVGGRRMDEPTSPPGDSSR